MARAHRLVSQGVLVPVGRPAGGNLFSTHLSQLRLRPDLVLRARWRVDDEIIQRSVDLKTVDGFKKLSWLQPVKINCAARWHLAQSAVEIRATPMGRFCAPVLVQRYLVDRSAGDGFRRPKQSPESASWQVRRRDRVPLVLIPLGGRHWRLRKPEPKHRAASGVFSSF
jgi:hypothetical protein